MQPPATPSARCLIDRARAIAADARVTPGTLHLLAAVFESPSALARALRSRGLRANDLRSLRGPVDEPLNALSRSMERAQQLAAQRGVTEVTGELLFVAALVERECAMVKLLRANGHDPVRLAEELAGLLPVARPAPVQRAVAAPAARPVARVAGMGPTAPVAQNSTMLSRVRLSPLDARMVSPSRAPAPSPAPAPGPAASPASSSAKPSRASRAQRPKDAPSPTFDLRATPVLASLVMPREDRGVEGREAELSRVRDAMGRAQAKGALLVGAPGSGRTAVIEALASRADRAVVCLRHAALVAELRSGPPERVRALCDELAKSRGALVLALDPVAPWFSARETPEELLLELRATLQSGAAPWVGVATAEEARRLAEVEPWIERAALRVELDELTGEALASVVDARAGALSERHGVALEDGAARRALALSERYLGGRAQPDRALGVVDLALARAKREGHTTLTSGVVASVVADVAGLPESRVAATDRERLLALEAELGRRVVGHADAIARVARVIRRNAVGFRGARPVGTFLFLGPTGVGKTETAKALAEALFPGAAPMTRFDMAEFSEPHAVSRLVGAPPGYVGYADGGQLTEAVRRRPYQLLLLDEIEKAHRDVIEALLGLLDEARLTDGRGRTADFRNTVVVMTSNLGAELYAPATRARAIGFGPTADPTELADPARVLDAARAALPPEVWNRIDEPLVFGALARIEVAEVARRMLADSAAKLEAEQGVAVEVRDAVVDLLLASGGWEPSLGARPMRRAVARCVEAPLADAVLRGELRRGDRVSLGVVDGAVRIER